MASRHGGHQVHLAHQGQGRGETADRDRQIPPQAQGLKRTIDRPAAPVPPRHLDMTGRQIILKTGRPAGQRVARMDDTDEFVPEQGLHPQLRPLPAAQHAGLDIDAALAEKLAVLFRLGHETKADRRCFQRDPAEQSGTETFGETIAAPKHEFPIQCGKVGGHDRPQHGDNRLRQRADPVPQI